MLKMHYSKSIKSILQNAQNALCKNAIIYQNGVGPPKSKNHNAWTCKNRIKTQKQNKNTSQPQYNQIKTYKNIFVFAWEISANCHIRYPQGPTAAVVTSSGLSHNMAPTPFSRGLAFLGYVGSLKLLKKL
eukprot:TRINITY_DN2244_c0_g1_i7.p3 TRINITY_DN2244_c0_g1~~TRINITY_DN2244_c0_g1_i7.p3  ORF type:complete len:130 (+),score=6.56 TRINITY_DN2244_c0_g1_i7:99-488(+)